MRTATRAAYKQGAAYLPHRHQGDTYAAYPLTFPYRMISYSRTYPPDQFSVRHPHDTWPVFLSPIWLPGHGIDRFQTNIFPISAGHISGFARRVCTYPHHRIQCLIGCFRAPLGSRRRASGARVISVQCCQSTDHRHKRLVPDSPGRTICQSSSYSLTSTTNSSRPGRSPSRPWSRPKLSNTSPSKGRP